MKVRETNISKESGKDDDGSMTVRSEMGMAFKMLL